MVTVESLVLLVLVVLVAGLLRSHAEILRVLHDHGLSTADDAAHSGRATPAAPVQVTATPSFAGPGRGGAGAHRPAIDITGITPAGEAVAVGVGTRPVMLAFLSSGCGTCAGFWSRLAEGGGVELDPYRAVVVTMDPARESESALRALQPPEVTVVMSTQAWERYDVPGSPYFVALDEGEVRGEGTAATWDQLLSLLRQAGADAKLAGSHPMQRRTTRGREERADAELAAAGILPGDARLHPPADGPGR